MYNSKLISFYPRGRETTRRYEAWFLVSTSRNERERERIPRPFCGSVINIAYPAGLFSNAKRGEPCKRAMQISVFRRCPIGCPVAHKVWPRTWRETTDSARALKKKKKPSRFRVFPTVAATVNGSIRVVPRNSGYISNSRRTNASYPFYGPPRFFLGEIFLLGNDQVTDTRSSKRDLREKMLYWMYIVDLHE